MVDNETNALLLTIINEFITNYEDDSLWISKYKIRRLKRRLKKLDTANYGRYKEIIKRLEYYLLMEIILT